MSIDKYKLNFNEDSLQELICNTFYEAVEEYLENIVFINELVNKYSDYVYSLNDSASELNDILYNYCILSSNDNLINILDNNKEHEIYDILNYVNNNNNLCNNLKDNTELYITKRINDIRNNFLVMENITDLGRTFLINSIMMF